VVRSGIARACVRVGRSTVRRVLFRARDLQVQVLTGHEGLDLGGLVVDVTVEPLEGESAA
jgi:hypothetical protein